MRYKTLLSVSIIHRYYSKGNGKVFCFEPTEDCARHLGRFSILFRTAADGFVLLFPCKQGKKDMPEHPIDEEVVFDFAIHSKDPYLLNYSELPFISPSSRVYRFSNLKKPKTINFTVIKTPHLLTYRHIIPQERFQFNQETAKRHSRSDLWTLREDMKILIGPHQKCFLRAKIARYFLLTINTLKPRSTRQSLAL